MALAVSIRYGFIDDEGKTSFTKQHVPNGFSIAQYIEFAQQAAQIFANTSVGQVTSASICVDLAISTATIKAVALAGADRFQKAYFQFSTALGGFVARFKLPAFWENKIVAGSDAVDQTDADVMALISAFEDGLVVTGGTIQPTDGRENDIVALQVAKEQFRRK